MNPVTREGHSFGRSLTLISFFLVLTGFSSNLLAQESSEAANPNVTEVSESNGNAVEAESAGSPEEKRRSTPGVFPVHFPTYNTDYMYFFLRSDRDLSQGLAGIHVRGGSDSTMDTEIKAFLPLYGNEEGGFVLPIYAWKTSIESDDPIMDFKTDVNRLFWQGIGRLKISEDLEALFIVENRMRGDDASIETILGNDAAALVHLNYKLNENWSLGGMVRTQRMWKEGKYAGRINRNLSLENNPGFEQFAMASMLGGKQDIVSEDNTIPAGMVNYRTDNFQITFGVPGILGVEWALPYNWDFVTHVMVENGDVLPMVALRKRWSSLLSSTLRFRRDGVTDMYTGTRTVPLTKEAMLLNQETGIIDAYNEAMESLDPVYAQTGYEDLFYNVDTYRDTYNNITHFQNTLQLELGFHMENGSQLQLIAGYTASEKIKLKQDDHVVYELNGKDEGFVGLNLEMVWEPSSY